MKNAIAALALALTLLVTPAFADPAAPAKPSKESLLEAWERTQKDSPYTAKIEKAGESGVYDYETTIFPFKGRLKVLNLLIEKKPAFYYGEFRNYNEDLPEGDYIGIVELELVGVDKEFPTKHRYSFSTWEQGNGFYYNAETNKWYTEEQWAAHRKALDTEKPVSDNASCTAKPSTKDRLIAFGIVAVLSALIMAAWSGSKQKWKRQKLQDEYAEMNKGFVQRSIESLALQKEMLEVLKNKK